MICPTVSNVHGNLSRHSCRTSLRFWALASSSHTGSGSFDFRLDYFLIQFRRGDPSIVGYVTAGFWAGITLGRTCSEFVLDHLAQIFLGHIPRSQNRRAPLCLHHDSRRTSLPITIPSPPSPLPPPPHFPKLIHPAGINPRAPRLVRPFHPVQFRLCRILWLGPRPSLPIRSAHLPTPHPTEKDVFLSKFDWECGQFWWCCRPLHDKYGCATGWNVCLASNLYWVVCGHGGQLVVDS